MDIWQIFATIITGLVSGVGGSILFYRYAQGKSKDECKKAVLRELEFGLYKGIAIVQGVRKTKIHISFKNIELLIYPNAIIKHPDLFDERDVFILSFIFNSFKTYNDNAPNLKKTPQLLNNNENTLSCVQYETYKRLVNLLWEDIIYFFNMANYNVIPESLRKYKSEFKELKIPDNPPNIKDPLQI